MTNEPKFQDVTDCANRVKFVQKLIDTQATVSVYLLNGIKLVGKILRQDRNVIVLTSRSSSSQLLYVNSIATIQAPK